MDTIALVSSMLFGAIGAGYLVYARKAGNPMFMAAGLCLWAFCAFIFFAAWVFLGLGIAVLILPFVLRI
ncbi:MAG: hypothetical protein R6U37_10190 [Dehalococcoidia bacterium]